MSMVEVDPKLFITCRLCLDEMGQYQIVPQVQMQIKYCFEIEVEPFDGLPQLICKKCETILSQYAAIKQIFQEKQSSLKLRTKENAKKDSSNVQEQKDATPISNQGDSDSSSVVNKTEIKKKNTQIVTSNSRTSSADRQKHDVNCQDRRSKSLWKNDYVKFFVCSFCSNSWKDRRSITKHLKHCLILKNYSNVIQQCFVKMNKIESKNNLTCSTENVVCNKNKIINCKNKDYYILYTLKATEKYEPSDTDDDFAVTKRKHKRRRLFSKSSNETLVIDENNISQNSFHSENDEAKHDLKDNKNDSKSVEESEVEYVSIDDSDTASTISNINSALNNETAIDDETSTKVFAVNDKVIQNIVTMCCKKYLKRHHVSSSDSKESKNVDAFLQRKILSMGRKVIHDKGLNSTGLIRYIEHKHLDVSWIPKNQTNVIIKTTLRENKSNESHIPWKTLNNENNFHDTKDFIDTFEKINKDKSNSLGSNKISNALAQFFVSEGRNQMNIENTPNSSNVQKSKSHLYFDSSKKNKIKNKIVEKKVENSVLYIDTMSETEKNSMLSKLLNANPVANPRQMPKKSGVLELHLQLTNSCSSTNSQVLPHNQASSQDNNVNDANEESTMPIITSTMSLANTCDTRENLETNQRLEIITSEETGQNKTILPRIKVKPVSELMPENNVSQLKGPIRIAANLFPTNVNRGYGSALLQDGNTSRAYVTNGIASCSNINNQITSIPRYPYNMNQTNSLIVSSSSNTSSSNRNITQKPSNHQLVTMHTVEIPNKKTNSPFNYFQELLQIHNITLLDSTHIVTDAMLCLIKFKLVFDQESSFAVALCLSLYYNRCTFCIRVTDIESKYLDIAKLSPYWQWEILKEFKGDIVSKLYDNASKIGPDVLTKTTYFVSLLRSIVFTR